MKTRIRQLVYLPGMAAFGGVSQALLLDPLPPALDFSGAALPARDVARLAEHLRRAAPAAAAAAPAAAATPAQAAVAEQLVVTQQKRAAEQAAEAERKAFEAAP